MSPDRVAIYIEFQEISDPPDLRLLAKTETDRYSSPMKQLPLLFLVFLLSTSLGGCAKEFSESFTNKKLESTFRSTNETLGNWESKAITCVHGKERGFEGIAFGFDAESPVEAIHLDTARNGDNVVEVRLADDSGTRLRVRERDCEVITGSIKQSNVTINNRHMFRLSGQIEFKCPKRGLSGRAEFEGCLPQTL